MTGLTLVAVATYKPSPAEMNHNLPLDRPYTLRDARPFLLESEYHRMIAGGNQRSYIFPRACISEIDSSSVCADGGLWRYRNGDRDQGMNLGFQGGAEYRRHDEDVYAFDPGFSATGHSGPVSFYLDARMFTELHEIPLHSSYDREFVDRQEKEMSGSVSYTSYSRYRSNISYDWSWGRITAARDAVHWGPGIFHNLVFHQDAVPFNQLVFMANLGPISVSSLYGALTIQGDESGRYHENQDSRTLYAHRYEWRIASDWLLGISEQLIFHQKTAPFAFAPIVPLFIAKGFEHERWNGGSMAGDLSYRLPGVGTIYSEFLLDDIISPTSLFDDYWGNKWAWMAGVHGIWQVSRFEGGFIGEYSRVEPWVYTGYKADTRQSANAGYPLGNQMGPNSQAFTFKAYLRRPGAWYISGRLDLEWKGTDLGSRLNDDRTVEKPERKVFIQGVDHPDIHFSPFLSYRWKSISAETRYSLGTPKGVFIRLSYQVE